MDLLFFLLAFLLGIALALWPSVSRKLSTFLDTVVHEAGHGLASLPFGAPLPSITVRKNTSGETLSSMGYLHQILPFGLGNLTEKIARFFSLMAGYPASIILASLLLVLASTPSQSFELWQIVFLCQVVLATVLWTAVKITSSFWAFLASAAVASAAYAYFFPWDWRINLAILGAVVVLGFLAKALLSTGALLLTLTAVVNLGVGIFAGASHPLTTLVDGESFSFDSLWIARLIFGLLLVFVVLCSRSWLSLALSVLMLGGILGLLFLPILTYSYVLTAVAAVLYTAGAKSFLELHAISFKQRPRHWQQEGQDTDMVFAAQELGGDPRYWYWITVAVALIASAGIFLWGYFL